jgi:hypothetical protein
MNRRIILLGVSAAMLGMAGPILAGTSIWTDGDPSSHYWDASLNWDNHWVPQPGDLAGVGSGATAGHECVIDDTIPSQACSNLIVAIGGNMIFDGGQLTVSDWTFVGHDGAQTAPGLVEMLGGTLNAGSLWIGNGGPGQVNAHGGTINTDDLILDAGLQAGLLDITEGVVIEAGNTVDTVMTWVGNGWITAYGGDPAYHVTAVYDDVSGVTRIATIPEPATLILLSLGSLLLRRKS